MRNPSYRFHLGDRDCLGCRDDKQSKVSQPLPYQITAFHCLWQLNLQIPRGIADLPMAFRVPRYWMVIQVRNDYVPI